MDNKQRTKENRRDNNLEEILTMLNSTLEDDERELTNHFDRPKFPPIFIVGNARSGTTLLYQWLASTGHFAYPSNIISRFYKAPYIGALIHKAFVDFDKFGEILGNESITFRSNLGKTKSAVSPHEFWYFWRRFFKFGEFQKLNSQELNKIDSDTLLKELAALEGAFCKPLLMKGMILNWNLDYLLKLIPNAILIHIKREPLYNMHSLFNARLKYFGDTKKWYSFKPPEYEALKSKDIYEQLAGQVFYTDRAISLSLNKSNSVLNISYENLVNNPKAIYKQVTNKLIEFGLTLDNNSYGGPTDFKSSNEITNDDFNENKAIEAYSVYQ